MVRSGCMLGRQDRGTKQRGVLRIFKKSDGDRSIAGAEQQGRLRSTQQVCVVVIGWGEGLIEQTLSQKERTSSEETTTEKAVCRRSKAMHKASAAARFEHCSGPGRGKDSSREGSGGELLRQKPTLRRMGCQASRVKQAMHTVTVPEGRNCAAASCTGLAGEGDATGSWSYRVWIEPIVVGSRHARPVSLVHVGKRSSKACGNCARIAVQRGQTSKMCEVVSCTPRSQKGQTGEETNLDL